MKTSNKLREVFDVIIPHINGHNTTINKFIEAIQEVHELEALSQATTTMVDLSICIGGSNNNFAGICTACGKRH